MTRVGDSVTLTHAVRPWYSGYGANRSVTLPAGLVGVVTAVDVPPVRGTRSTPGYSVARFTFEGESWQVSDREAGWTATRKGER